MHQNKAMQNMHLKKAMQNMHLKKAMQNMHLKKSYAKRAKMPFKKSHHLSLNYVK